MTRMSRTSPGGIVINIILSPNIILPPPPFLLTPLDALAGCCWSRRHVAVSFQRPSLNACHATRSSCNRDQILTEGNGNESENEDQGNGKEPTGGEGGRGNDVYPSHSLYNRNTLYQIMRSVSTNMSTEEQSQIVNCILTLAFNKHFIRFESPFPPSLAPCASPFASGPRCGAPLASRSSPLGPPRLLV